MLVVILLNIIVAILYGFGAFVFMQIGTPTPTQQWDLFLIIRSLEVGNGLLIIYLTYKLECVFFKRIKKYKDITTRLLIFIFEKLVELVDKLFNCFNIKKKKIKKYKPKIKEELKKLVDDLSVNLGDIDVSNITDMEDLFYKSERINFDGIETWDVSNVKNMLGMFDTSTFNGNISNWDVSNVKDMYAMFRNSPFNGNISNWDVSNVEDMKYMFRNSTFSGNISMWKLNENVSIDNNTLKRIKGE